MKDFDTLPVDMIYVLRDVEETKGNHRNKNCEKRGKS